MLFFPGPRPLLLPQGRANHLECALNVYVGTKLHAFNLYVDLNVPILCKVTTSKQQAMIRNVKCVISVVNTIKNKSANHSKVRSDLDLSS